MSQPLSNTAIKLPRWAIWAGSVAILFHLGALGVNALAAPSGPWPDSGMIRFAFVFYSVDGSLKPVYLSPLGFARSYHLLANRQPELPGVSLEFRLKDKEGKEVATVMVPDRNANPWVYHRQSILSQQPVWDDDLLIPPQGEVIPAPGQEAPTVQFWNLDQGRLKLVTVSVNQIPKDRPVRGPRDLSYLLAGSYARYLCRAHGAAKAELLRHHQEVIGPGVLEVQTVPKGIFEEVISEFGEFPK